MDATKPKGVWAGIVGPVLFVSVFLIEGWIRPDYSASRLEVSALSLGPRGSIQILNFVITGSLFLLFSNGLTRLSKSRNGIWLISRLLFLLGICLIFSGLFVMDSPSAPRDSWTLHGWVHRLLGAVVFTIFPVSCFLSWILFRYEPHWQRFRWWSFLAGCLIVLGIVCMKTGQLQPHDSFLASRLGLFQRIVLLVYMGWVFALAWQLNRLNGITPQSASQT